MDEDSFVCDTLTKILLKMDFLVTSTNNAQKAYKKIVNARIINKPFNIVIADLTINHSRKGSALTLLEKLNGEFAKTKIIVHSGWTFAPKIFFPKKYGFDASLAKPSNHNKIIATILNVFLENQAKRVYNINSIKTLYIPL